MIHAAKDIESKGKATFIVVLARYIVDIFLQMSFNTNLCNGLFGFKLYMGFQISYTGAI